MGEANVEDAPKERERSRKKKEKPIKIVIRRLPPCMTWDELAEQLAPLPPTVYTSFVAADPTFIPHAFARCYLAFTDEATVLEFSNRFNRYVFVDSRGNESMAVVELAMYHRIPRSGRENVKKDNRCGIIEDEVEYKQFVTKLEADRHASILTMEEQLLHVQLQEKCGKAASVQETPLTQYIVKKNDEYCQRKEERRRRDDERRRKRDKERRDRDYERTKDRVRSKPAAESSGTTTKKKEHGAAADADWDKLKKDLGIGVAAKTEKTKESTRVSSPRDRTAKDAYLSRTRDRVEKEKPVPSEREPGTGRGSTGRSLGSTRTFVRSAPAAERVTAMSRDQTDKRKPRVRPERALYRPGQRVRKNQEEESGENATKNDE